MTTQSSFVLIPILAFGLAFAGCGRNPMDEDGFIPGSGSTAVSTGFPTEASVRDAGACLLSYNSALVTGDPCCYREGAVNTCNTSIGCNDRAGRECCLLYASEGTQLGQTCCLYDNSGRDGKDVNDYASECQQLLSSDRN